jgi:hypothetical protein
LNDDHACNWDIVPVGSGVKLKQNVFRQEMFMIIYKHAILAAGHTDELPHIVYGYRCEERIVHTVPEYAFIL